MRSSAEIQIDLNAAYTARRTALEAQSYSLDTGQGKQAVTRANLDQINKTIQTLQDELEAAVDSESGIPGIVAAQFRRFP